VVIACLLLAEEEVGGILHVHRPALRICRRGIDERKPCGGAALAARGIAWAIGKPTPITGSSPCLAKDARSRAYTWVEVALASRANSG
jgi:hypothetical protein